MPSWPAELPPPAVPPEDARRAADDILSRPEYREPEPSLVERVLEAIGDFLGEAIAALTGSGPGGVIATVVVVGLLGVAVWFLVRSLGAGRGGAQPGTEPLVQGTTAPDDPATWIAEADRLAAAGNHRSALRCRYQAMIARLLRDGAVEDVPGRTPRELAAELVVQRPATEDDVGTVTEQFERAWYGGASVTADGYRRFSETAGRVEEHQLPTTARRPQEAGA